MQKCIVEYISEDDCIVKENHVSKRHAIKNKYADVAQLAEQLICNQQVNGSSPFIGFLGKRKSLRKAKDSEVINDDFGESWKGSSLSKLLWADSRVAKGGRL